MGTVIRTTNLIWYWVIILFILLIRLLTIIQSAPVFLLSLFLGEEVLSLALICAWVLQMPIAIILLMLLKLGIPPAHIWLIPILQQIKWYAFRIFITIYKLAPITLAIHLFIVIPLVFLLLFFSALVFLLTIRYFRPILLFSSNINLIWIWLICSNSCKLAIIFLIIYLAIILAVLISSSLTRNLSRGLLVLIMGLPPLLFFLVKWATRILNFIPFYVLIAIFSGITRTTYVYYSLLYPFIDKPLNNYLVRIIVGFIIGSVILLII